MNIVFLVLSIILIVFLLIGGFFIKKIFQNSLLDLEIKQKGLLYFYQYYLLLIFQKQEYKDYKLIFFFWIYYLALNLITPIFLSTFLLKNDWNVLIAIFTILASSSIYNRVFQK